MLKEEPTFEIVGGDELSDAAISALAALLLSVVEQQAVREEENNPSA